MRHGSRWTDGLPAGYERRYCADEGTSARGEPCAPGGKGRAVFVRSGGGGIVVRRLRERETGKKIGKGW